MWKTLEQSISSKSYPVRGSLWFTAHKQQIHAGSGGIPQAAPILQWGGVQVPHGSGPGHWFQSHGCTIWHRCTENHLLSFFQCPTKALLFAQVMAQQEWGWVKEVFSAWGHESIHPSTGNQVFRRSSSKHYGMGPQKKVRWCTFKHLHVFKAVKSVVWFVAFVWDFFSPLKWGLGKQPKRSILLTKVLPWDLQKSEGADNPVSCLFKTYIWEFYDFDLGKHEILLNPSLKLLWFLSFELQCGWANSSSLGTQCFAILKLKCLVF